MPLQTMGFHVELHGRRERFVFLPWKSISKRSQTRINFLLFVIHHRRSSVIFALRLQKRNRKCTGRSIYKKLTSDSGAPFSLSLLRGPSNLGASKDRKAKSRNDFFLFVCVMYSPNVPSISLSLFFFYFLSWAHCLFYCDERARKALYSEMLAAISANVGIRVDTVIVRLQAIYRGERHGMKKKNKRGYSRLTAPCYYSVSRNPLISNGFVQVAAYSLC